MTYNNQISYDFLEVVRHIPILEMLIADELIKIWSTWVSGTASGKLFYVYWMLAIICNGQVTIILRMISEMYLCCFHFFSSGEG